MQKIWDSLYHNFGVPFKVYVEYNVDVDANMLTYVPCYFFVL
jgi:hypothetical protein